MASNGNGTQKIILWIIGLLFAVALGAAGVNHAEIIRLDDKKVGKDTYNQLCGRLDRIESKLDRLIMDRRKR